MKRSPTKNSQRTRKPRRATDNSIREPLALKITRAAELIGVNRSSVYELCRAKKLRYVRLAGGTILIPRSAIDEFLGSAVA
jgi:excisionase family DNA binding protein